MKRETFFSLVRAALTGDSFTENLTDDDWRMVYDEVERQSLLGVVYGLASRMAVPFDIAMRWAGGAETIRGLNVLLNEEAARQTQLFAGKGRRTAVLKGQANAMLYPDPLSRQPGDIDLWVEGGKKSVVALLRQMGLMPGNEALTMHYHHVHLPENERGVTVEIHFRPSSGNMNPLTNRRLQRWLEQRILSSTMTDKGFCVPPMPFALVMQLAHIQRHFIEEGVGLRQVCDYFLLLQSASDADRQEVAAVLGSLGLRHAAGALMWLLSEMLHLDHSLMLCQPDSRRGQMLLHEIMAGGNFGHYADRHKLSLLRRVAQSRLRRLGLMRFDFWEAFWLEMNYLRLLVVRMPLRIKYRRWSLRDIPA